MMVDDYRINDVIQQLRDMRQENNDAHNTIFTYLQTQNDRVRKLEQWRAFLTGGLALLTFILGITATLLIIKPL